MNIAVVGSGSWGTAITLLLGNKGYSVRLWSWLEKETREISDTRENRQFLPGFRLPDSVSYSSDLSEVVRNTEIIVLAVPSCGLRGVVADLRKLLPEQAVVVQASKGLESSTGLRGSEVIIQELGDAVANRCAVLSGPNLAVEIARGIPTATVVASTNPAVAEQVQRVFHCPTLRTYRNDDVVGVELGGALKNVFAIGAGISDGLGYGDNTKATLVTRGIKEMMRLGDVLGARRDTFFGLSGIGDLMATCGSKLSRNLRTGLMLAQGKTVGQCLEEIGQVAEGIPTCEAAFLLSRKHDISMPITEQIFEVVFRGKSPTKAVKDLMDRVYTDELL